MGGHEPRDPERENVAYGPWAAWRKSDVPGSHRLAGAEQHAAVSSANAMDCENAPAPSFVRTQSPPPYSSLPDHGTASLLVEAHPPPSESRRDNLFLEGDADQQPGPSPESRPPADDHPSGEHGLVAPLGASSWSATAAAHRPDPVKFTRPPDSVARRLLPTRPPQVSARLAFSGAAASVGIAIIAFIASVGAPGWLPMIGVSGNGPHTLSHRASTSYHSSIPSSESTTGLDHPRPNPHLAAALRATLKSTSRGPAHRKSSHTTLFVHHRGATPARYVSYQSSNSSSSSTPPTSQSAYTPPSQSSQSYTPATSPSSNSAPSAPSSPVTRSSTTTPAATSSSPSGPVGTMAGTVGGNCNPKCS
jgi:hypothetical protein